MRSRGVGAWRALWAVFVVGVGLLGCSSADSSSLVTPDIFVVRLPSGAVQVHISSCYDGTVGAIVLRRAAKKDDLLWAAQGGELGKTASM